MQINTHSLAVPPAGASTPFRSEQVNTEQLRSAIDHGRTGDKIKWSDPADAPLGTDEEAGIPVPPPAVAMALRYETALPSDTNETSGPVKAQNGKGRTFVITLTVAIFVGLLFVLVGTA